MDTVTVSTKCGDVTGILRQGSRLFRGIPYATAERFEYPQQITDFGGSFDATQDPLECPQLSTYTDDSERYYTKEFRRGMEFRFAESPLTLSVITPENPENCPVLVYIHGGGFFNGKQSEAPAGDSDEYAKRGIILVSIAYRLNVFGLYRCENYYLYDQITAIKWVRDNIASFGGNPEEITIIGQSAGAMSVFQLLYTDVLKGVIKGAVMMSGAGFFPSFGNGYTKKQGKRFWDMVMTEAGCRSDEELKRAPAETVWRAWTKVREEHGSLHQLQPGVDGKIIYAQPSKIRRSGKMLDVPMLVGVTAQDMMVPLIIFNMAKRFALWSEKHGRRVYTYYFDRVPPGNMYKAFHASDLWYVFGNMEKSWRPWEKEDYELSAVMADCVAKFVKEGNPGWEPYGRGFRKFRRFNTSREEYVSPADCFGELVRNTIFERGPF